MMREVDYRSVTDKALKQIEEGAFLTVQAGSALNVMTIGWAAIGTIWGRPILTVLVRPSRYSFGIIDAASEFTVSAPLVDMRKELEFCGSQSGRKIDKFKACKLEIFPGMKVKTPILDIAGIHFECRIVYKSPVDPSRLVDSYKRLYPAGDYHTVYYGEIVYCCSTDDRTQ